MVPGGLIAYAMRLAKYTRNEAARALRKALASRDPTIRGQFIKYTSPIQFVIGLLD